MSQTFLRQLVEINSGSRNTTGVRAVQDIVASRLKAIGFTIRFEGPAPLTQMLIAERDGIGREAITLICHADTVFELESGFTEFKVNGSQAFGPGVIDDKGGIVVMLRALEEYLKGHTRPRRLRVVCSPNEELGSPGFAELLLGIGKTSELALGFEPALEDGGIVHSRQGNLWYKLSVTGKAGHAGRDFRTSVNAAHELCNKLGEFQKISGKAGHPTVNIGAIHGGSDKFNIVCGEAHALVDIRVRTAAELKTVEHRVAKILKQPTLRSPDKKHRAAVDCESRDRCPPFSEDKRQAPLIARYLKILKKIEGTKARAGASHGSSDCNYLGAHPIVLDGLGPRGRGLHTMNETIELPSLETRGLAAAEFLKTLD